MLELAKTLTNQVGFVGEGEEFAVATTVAVCGETVGGTVGMEGDDATDLFLAVAVGREETAGEATVDDFDLSAENVECGMWNVECGKERSHPVVDAGADDKYFGAFGEGLL